MISDYLSKVIEFKEKIKEQSDADKITALCGLYKEMFNEFECNPKNEELETALNLIERMIAWCCMRQNGYCLIENEQGLETLWGKNENKTN